MEGLGGGRLLLIPPKHRHHLSPNLWQGTEGSGGVIGGRNCSRQSLPATTLWQQLGYKPDLPWGVTLQVELDGTLLPQVHTVEVRRGNPQSLHLTQTCLVPTSSN